jgi:hypothetical protein
MRPILAVAGPLIPAETRLGAHRRGRGADMHELSIAESIVESSTG